MVQGTKILRLHLRNPVLEAPCSISGGFYWKRLCLSAGHGYGNAGTSQVSKSDDTGSPRIHQNLIFVCSLLAQWFSILREVLMKSLLLILSVTGWLPKHSKNKSKCLKHVETANPSLPWNFRTSPAFPKKRISSYLFQDFWRWSAGQLQIDFRQLLVLLFVKISYKLRMPKG